MIESYLLYVFLVILFFILFYFSKSIFRLFKNNKSDLKINKLIFFGFGYFVLFIISLLWIFNFLDFNSRDFILLSSILVVVNCFILVNHSSRVILNNKINLFLLFFIIPIGTYFIFIDKTLLSLLIVSFVLILFAGYMMKISDRGYKKSSFYIMTYSFLSLILFFILGNNLIYFVIVNLLFCVSLYFFLKDFEKEDVRVKFVLNNKNSYFVLFIRYFIFILVITSIVLASTIFIHEFGHVVAAKYYDCDYKTILFYEGNYPYTEVFCDDSSNKFILTLSGIILPFVVCILLFLIGGKIIKEISVISAGFNFLASFKDLAEINLGGAISITSLIIGVALIIIGVVMLAMSEINEAIKNYFSNNNGKVY